MQPESNLTLFKGGYQEPPKVSCINCVYCEKFWSGKKYQCQRKNLSIDLSWNSCEGKFYVERQGWLKRLVNWVW